jgi:zinc protease
MSKSSKENGVLKTRLRNGLEVRLKELHIAPLISSWVWYRVGSRNEHAGVTGISHWVEHMQFKGTPTYPANVLDRAISRYGGFWNALTYLDWTAYFETMPADRIDLAIELEADRMQNSLFDAKEVELERTVVISERQGSENSPYFRLSEEVQAAAFRVHSYHHEVIGDMADLERITRQDLYEHYRQYYNPANAILAMAGDFNSTSMMKKIRDAFGSIPKQPKPDFVARREPSQSGERRVRVEGPGETPFLQIAYRAPEGNHPDFMPLAVLDSILSGPSSLNLFGDTISNKTCRLYQALVEGEFAASVHGNLSATVDPFIYTIAVTVRPDRDPEDALKVVDQEIDQLLEKRIQPDELLKAIKQAKAMFAYGSESTTNQAFWLGYSEMFADYDWFEKYLDRIVEVTSEQVMDVAQRYLLPTKRIVGIYHPAGGGLNG